MSMLLTALDIANALAYLHAQKVVHGDLKAHNVLLKSTSADERGFYCKVGDFGLSRMMLNNKTQIETFTCGTVRYMPPELLRDGLMTPACGRLLVSLICTPMPCRLPWPICNSNAAILQ